MLRGPAEQAARQDFADAVIDRLFVLNTEPAAEEAKPETKKAKKPARKGAKTKAKKAAKPS